MHTKFEKIREEYEKTVQGVVVLSNDEQNKLDAIYEYARFLYNQIHWKCDIYSNATGSHQLIESLAEDIKARYPSISEGDSIMAAEHEIKLHARQIASTLSSVFSPNLESVTEWENYDKRLRERPKVIFFQLSPEHKTAYFTPNDNTIHLDMRYGTWQGLPLCAIHEFGHWFDWHVRMSINPSKRLIPYIEEFKEAAKIDWGGLCKDKEGSLIPHDKLARLYGNGYTYWMGDYFKDVISVLFSKDDFSKLTMNEKYILSSFADAIQNMTNGQFGWGHSIEYSQNDNVYGEAFADSFLLFLKKDKRFRLDFPNIWNYFKNKFKL